MAVDDIISLRNELPDLFLDITLPFSWKEEWEFQKIDKPESVISQDETILGNSIEAQLEKDYYDTEASLMVGNVSERFNFGKIMVPDFHSKVPLPGTNAP